MSCTGCGSCDDCDNSLGLAKGDKGDTGATGATGAQGPAGEGWLTGHITVPTASVLTGFASPYAAIAAPGAGLAVEIISAVPAVNTYGGTPYATNTVLQMITDTATTAQCEDSQILLSAGARRGKMVMQATAGTTDTMIIENKAVFIKVKTGNPTAGNSNIDVYFTYRIITL
jgi:hypothetical protein